MEQQSVKSGGRGWQERGAAVWKPLRVYFVGHPFASAALVATLIAALFYRHHTAYLPTLWQSLLLLPLLLLNFSVFYYSGRALRRRLSDPVRRLWPELLGATLVAALLWWGDLRHTPIWLQLALLLLLAWLYLLAVQRSLGLFYALVVGLVLALTVLYSFRLLNYEVRLLLTLRQQLIAREMATAAESLRSLSTAGENYYRIFRDERPLFGFYLPEKMEYYVAAEMEASPLRPYVGQPLALISSGDSAWQSPSLSFWRIDGEVDLVALQEEFALALGHRRRSALLRDLSGPERRESPLPGIFYRYTEAGSEQPYQLGFYLLPLFVPMSTSPKSGEEVREGEVASEWLLILIEEPQLPAFPHHPDLLYILRTLEVPPRLTPEERERFDADEEGERPSLQPLA